MVRKRIEKKLRNDGRAIASDQRIEGRMMRLMRRQAEQTAEAERRTIAAANADFAGALGAYSTASQLPGKPPGAPGSIFLEVTDSGYIVCDSGGDAVVCTSPQPDFCWCTEGTPGGSAGITIGEPIVPGDVNKRSERFLSVIRSFGGTIRTLRKSFVVSVPENYTQVKGMLTIAYLGNTQPVQQTQQSLATRPGAKSWPLASLIEHPRACHGVFGTSSTFEGTATSTGATLIEQFTFDPRMFFENINEPYPGVTSIVDARHLASPHWYIAVAGANASAPIYVTARTTYEIIPLAGICILEGQLRVANEADLSSAALTLGDLGPFPEPIDDVVDAGEHWEDPEDSSESDDEDFHASLDAAVSTNPKIAAAVQRRRELRVERRAARRAARPVPVVNYRRKPQGGGLQQVGNGMLEKYYGLDKKPDGWWQEFMSNSGRGIQSVWNTLFDIASLGEAVADDPQIRDVAEKASMAALA